MAEIYVNDEIKSLFDLDRWCREVCGRNSRDFSFDSDFDLQNDTNPRPYPNPFACNGKTKIYKPSCVSPRVAAQRGYMMRQVFEGWHEKNNSEGQKPHIRIKPALENEIFEGRIFSAKINPAFRENLISELKNEGISKSALFPTEDENVKALETLCAYLNLKIVNRWNTLQKMFRCEDKPRNF